MYRSHPSKSRLNKSVISLVFCLLSNITYAASSNNFDATVHTELDICVEALSATPATPPFSPEPRKPFQFISWNIQKGLNQGWRNELRSIAQQADIVLLQEATLTPDMQQPANQAIFWSFAEGYSTNNYRSGLLTLTRSRPDLACSLTSKEPWLKTPKMVAVIRIPHYFKDNHLLLINVHAVNFTFGIKHFAQQLDILSTLLRNYTGPVIIGGDMNTWNGARETAFENFLERNQLSNVQFSEDKRITKFGKPLDHISFRGLNVVASYITETQHSDHNPLFTVFTETLREGAEN